MIARARQKMTMNFLWVIVGGIAFVLGAIGVPLPGWPTTIFWIIAAYCFANSRPEWRDWIYARPGVGPLIEDFNEHGVLSRKAKVSALIGMGLGGLLATVFLWQKLTWLWGTWVLIGIGAVIVLSRPSSQDRTSRLP